MYVAVQTCYLTSPESWTLIGSGSEKYSKRVLRLAVISRAPAGRTVAIWICYPARLKDQNNFWCREWIYSSPLLWLCMSTTWRLVSALYLPLSLLSERCDDSRLLYVVCESTCYLFFLHVSTLLSVLRLEHSIVFSSWYWNTLLLL